MLSANDIRTNLAAIWRLFVGDAQGIDALDTSFRGFWISFAALSLLIPVYIAYALAEQAVLSEATSAQGRVTISTFGHAVAFLLDCVTFPLIMIPVCQLLDRQSRYVHFVVAYNWGSVVAVTVMALPILLSALGLMPLELSYILSIFALALALRLLYIIARVALFATISLAVAVVVLDFVVALLLAEVAQQIFAIDPQTVLPGTPSS